MEFEVENKFRVYDFSETEACLNRLHTQFSPSVEQVDLYFSHPIRDFVATDEALRLRRVGRENAFTYKGPKIDRETKTRREIELECESGDLGFAKAQAFLEALSFRAVREVRKQRRLAELLWEHRKFVIALDHVARLGFFVELETQATAADLPSTTSALQALALHLRLTNCERRSYLELLEQSADS